KNKSTEFIKKVISEAVYGHSNDNTRAINKYLKTQSYENIQDYLDKNKSGYHSYITQALMFSDLLPSDDPEINDKEISLRQAQIKRNIYKEAIQNPKEYIDMYEKMYNDAMDDIDREYLKRIQYYISLGYNKKQAINKAKEFIKLYKKERLDELDKFYPTSVYNKAIDVYSKSKVIRDESKKMIKMKNKKY